MQLQKDAADIYIPDGTSKEAAITRTTKLGITAHQDDIEIAMYGAIADCYGQSDKWFTGVVLTNGAGSPRSGIYADHTNEEMQTVRHEEQRKAAHIGDYAALIQLMHASSEVKDSSNDYVVEDIKQILSIAKPEEVYLHNPADKHDTHVASMMRCIAAIRQMPESARPQKVIGCEVWRGLDWMLDDEKVTIDVDRYPNIAAAVLGVYDSQISGGKRYDLATAGRRLANATYYASHATDESSALTYAIDLTPATDNREIPVEDLIGASIDRFRKDVSDRIARMA